jgi:D-alanyl-D-alanine carboxypeptidase (penicillin-binding protein 5/6)
MMTALVAWDHLEMDELVTISQTAADVGEAEVGLIPGEQIPAGDLFTAMLVRSANDAAMAVAERVGGSIDGFARMMNEKAEEMGLTSSHFVNPHGLDDSDHYSSAADLLAIERALLSIPELAAIVRSLSFDFPIAPDGTERGGDATNHLLTRYEGAIGVKTGFTFEAGLVLAAAAERGDRLLMAVVMGSEGEGGHFVDAIALLNYGFSNARILPVIQGLGYTVGDGTVDPVIAAARIEAMAWLATAGVLIPPPPTPAPQPIVVQRGPEEVPGWPEAVGWAERYWMWLVGER